MSRIYSQSRKAVRERGLRNRRASERMFNIPLQKFIEHKYPSIHNEYIELFNVMRTAHPNRRKLETSTTFREWMIANPAVETRGEQSPTASALVIPRLSGGDIINHALQEALHEETPAQNNNQNSCQDNANLQPPAGQIPNENSDPFNDLEDILEEMMGNDDVRNMLMDPDPAQDEGIELTELDDIVFDIEPFDFNLEVEPYDF